MDRVIANSQSTASMTVQAGVAADRISIVHPGVELPDSLTDDAAVADFRAKHELGERPLLISVGRLSTRKGLREFVSHALPKIVTSCPDVRSEEHTSELQSLMRISSAVFCLKKKNQVNIHNSNDQRII